MFESSQTSLSSDVGPGQLVRLDMPCQEISSNLPQSQGLCSLAQGLVRIWDIPEHGRLEYGHGLPHRSVPFLGFRLDEIFELLILDEIKRIFSLEHDAVV